MLRRGLVETFPIFPVVASSATMFGCTKTQGFGVDYHNFPRVASSNKPDCLFWHMQGEAAIGAVER